jgi:hypothetical protein
LSDTANSTKSWLYRASNFYITADNNIYFYTGGYNMAGAQPLFLGSSGNVGIGTTNPTSKLAVVASSGAVGITATASVNQWAQAIYGDSTASQSYGLYINAGTNSTDYPLYILKKTNAALFHVRGDGYGYLAASAWAYGSDRRLKENISYIPSATGLDKILQLKPAKFDYINGQKGQLGFIAQDIQEVIPEAISVDEKTGMLGLKTDFIIPYLVNAIKELSVDNKELKNLICQDHLSAEVCQK